MSIKKRYAIRLPNCNAGKYIFKSGKEAPFVNGEFLTDVESEIAELDAEVKAKHPHIFIEVGKEEVDSDQPAPLEALRAKIIADYLETQRAANNPANDRGNTVMGQLQGIGTSASAGVLSAESSSTPAVSIASPKK